MDRLKCIIMRVVPSDLAVRLSCSVHLNPLDGIISRRVASSDVNVTVIMRYTHRWDHHLQVDTQTSTL